MAEWEWCEGCGGWKTVKKVWKLWLCEKCEVDLTAALSARPASAGVALAKEVSGCWSRYEAGLRSVMGHTNYNVVAEKVRAVLDSNTAAMGTTK